MLKIDLKVGESLMVGTAMLTLEDKSGRVARLAIEAERSVPIHRIKTPTAAEIAAMRGVTGVIT